MLDEEVDKTILRRIAEEFLQTELGFSLEQIYEMDIQNITKSKREESKTM